MAVNHSVHIQIVADDNAAAPALVHFGDVLRFGNLAVAEADAAVINDQEPGLVFAAISANCDVVVWYLARFSSQFAMSAGR